MTKILFDFVFQMCYLKLFNNNNSELAVVSIPNCILKELKVLSKYCDHATNYFVPFLIFVIATHCFAINIHQIEDIWLKMKKRFIKFSFSSTHEPEIHIGI